MTSTRRLERMRAGVSQRADVEGGSNGVFFAISTLIFVASVTVTIVWCASMSGMAGMDMPGGWTMSMAWMRMPGQTWLGATLTFIGMWVVMMVAMMLPTLVPILWRYRRAVRNTNAARLEWLTALVGVGYFSVWILLGLALFPAGAALAELQMQRAALSRAVPLAVGIVIVIAGALQFSAWKTRHLACCRAAIAGELAMPASIGTAWRYGIRLGVHCVHCCAGLTAMLLVLGVMDLRAMAAVMATLTAERLAPAGWHVAHIVGASIVALGLFVVARAASSLA